MGKEKRRKRVQDTGSEETGKKTEEVLTQNLGERVQDTGSEKTEEVVAQNLLPDVIFDFHFYDRTIEDFCRLAKAAGHFGIPTRYQSGDGIVPFGASKKHHAEFCKLWSTYNQQLRESEGFDIDVFPGEGMDVVVPYREANQIEVGSLVALAVRGIKKYANGPENSSNGFKYKFLRFEKMNQMMWHGGLYFMTVRVSNLTLGSIETLQIQGNLGTRKIYLSRSKTEEAMEIIKAKGGRKSD